MHSAKSSGYSVVVDCVAIVFLGPLERSTVGGPKPPWSEFIKFVIFRGDLGVYVI